MVTNHDYNGVSLPFCNPELVIGLVGAVGIKLSKITVLINTVLNNYNYEVIHIRVSNELIGQFVNINGSYNTEYDRIKAMMEAGTQARNKYGKEVLALAASKSIRQYRLESDGEDPQYISRRAYIINSLKHPDEVNTLREIYGDGFYLIGVYSDEDKRISVLMNDYKMKRLEAVDLIETDKDEHLKYGQKTSETYHMSDLFVCSDDIQGGHSEYINRFIDTIFGHPYITPTFDEFAMFMAYSSSFRSADLSRQIGAVISKNNEIIATGANDCPRYGGGLYWPKKVGSTIQDYPDGRDYMRGYDSNAKEINAIAEEISKEIVVGKKEQNVVKEKLLSGRLKSITEYGRVVHAEMEALLSCARNGVSPISGTLYSTTFPCHNCAKHIIAAGIERVVYIEPYPKSKAFEFHSDSISLGLQRVKNHISFEPFVGMGPRRFHEYFSVNLGTRYKKIRKDEDGKILPWKPEAAILRVKMTPSHYLDRELEAANRVTECLEGRQDGARTEKSEEND